VTGTAHARRLWMESRSCLARPRKVPPFARLVPRLPPARPAALPRPGCPPPAPAWLRTSLCLASGPRCRRRNTARRFAQARASHRCSSRSHGAGESARPSGRVVGDRPAPAVCVAPLRRPCHQDGASGPIPAPRALRVVAPWRAGPAIPPQSPHRPAAPACAPAVLATAADGPPLGLCPRPRR
jgi:hypothetical protein